MQPLLTESVGWWVLFPRQRRPGIFSLCWARWIGESVDTLLPVAGVGGDIVKTALLMWPGLPGALIGAIVVVDLTLTIATQAAFTLLGLTLLIHLAASPAIVAATLAVLFAAVVTLIGFYAFQRKGMFGGTVRFLQSAVGAARWEKLIGSGDVVDAAIATLRRDRRRVAKSTFWLFVAWTLGAGEIWLSLHFLGYEVSPLESLMIESLIQAVRAIAFVIPWAVEVQEGTFLVLGAAIGIGADVSIALAMVRRVRELCVGLPGLIVWQVNETLRLWRVTVVSGLSLNPRRNK